MKTNFSTPSEIDGLKAKVMITEYEFQPFVRDGQLIEKIIDRKEVEIPLDGTLLTHDTCSWSGYFLNLQKLATRAANQFSNPISVQLIDVL
jgi:hypothetical protein